ncbi:hypothetical protein FACS1894201_10630 [Bacteroidia bacterium]|nr:hypothetical protein FACS1894201_10630 [Bacteroidia bacterium]
MPAFTASRLSSDNTLFPDRIEIDATNVTFYKGYVFGYQSTVIARNNVASVSIGSGILFADVVIESNGGKRIVASGFRKVDAREIIRLLT